MLSSSETAINVKKLNQLVWQIFTKSYGLTLQADAATFLIDKVTSYSMNETQMTEFLNYMAQNYGKISKDRSGMIHKANIELVFNQVYQSQDYKDSAGGKSSFSDVRKYIKVINAADTPKFDYDVHGKSFKKNCNSKNNYFGTAEDKISVGLGRFNLIKQRLLKQLRSGTLFPESSKINLSPIKSIKGIASPTNVRYVFGMISEIVEGSFSLEDSEDSILLDFSKFKENMKDFFLTESSIILVKGFCLGNRFQVESLMVPPVERRAETLAMLTHPDMSEATNFAEPQHELHQMEIQAQKARFVILSDIWLDQPKVLDRLKTLFDGFNASQGSLPELFVLIGPFSSNPPKDGPLAWSHYQDLFDNFAEFIERIKNVRQSRFVFIPADNDPGFIQNLLPRPPIPDSIFDAWKRAKLDFFLASNPCRIIYFSQEIAVFKNDLTIQMRKESLNQTLLNNIVKSKEEDNKDPEVSDVGSESKNLSDHQKSVMCLLDQASLSPFPISSHPILWNFTHSLSLYPIPDALIIAERQNSYEFTYEDCKCANPGSFPSSEGSFLLYNPSAKRFDLCELPK